MKFDSLFFTIGTHSKIFVFVLFSYDPKIQFETAQDVLQILLGNVRNNFVNVFACLELNITFYNGLNWFVFFRAINGRVKLETNNQIVAMGFGFFKHFDMPGVEQIEGGKGGANSNGVF